MPMVVIGILIVTMLYALRAPTSASTDVPESSHRGRPAAYVNKVESDDNKSPSFSAPSFSAPSFSAPSFEAPSPEAATPTPPPPPPPAGPPPKPLVPGEEIDANGRSANPYIAKYITSDVRTAWADMEKKRKENSDEIKAKFGSWAPHGTFCHHCWEKVDGKNVVTEGQCPCDGHNWDNQTNWDVTRRKFCNDLNAKFEKDHPFPEELKYTVELTYGEGLDDLGNMKVPYRALDGGKPHGELSFDPAIMMDHFLKLRAALAWYSQGEEILEQTIDPKPNSPEYRTMLGTIAKRLAGSFVNGGDLIVSVIGDSTTAGADNCFFDAWPNGIERQLKPFFGAAGVNFSVRDGGHNGGFKMAPQLACAGPIIGPDADFLMQSSPFVHPNQEQASFEDMIRRAAVEGVIVNVANGAESLLKAYAEFGFTSGGNPVGKPFGYNWYPSLGKSNWGRIGDGLCHVTTTRSKSSAVSSRNWHPGPLGHEGSQDSRVFLLADAAVEALKMIQLGLIESEGKVAPLKKRWPGKIRVKPSDLPEPVKCKDGDHSKSPLKQLCSVDSPIQYGFATCYTFVRPVYGENVLWQDVLVDPDDAPDWGTKKITVTPNHNGPKSNYDRKWACDNKEQCKEPVESRAETPETVRSRAACTHMDFVDELQLNKEGMITIKIPKGRMHVGTISICGDKCKPSQAKLKAAGMDIKSVSLSWGKSPEWGFDNDCALISETLDEAALKGDVYIGIPECSGKLEYVFAQ